MPNINTGSRDLSHNSIMLNTIRKGPVGISSVLHGHQDSTYRLVMEDMHLKRRSCHITKLRVRPRVEETNQETVRP